MIAFTLFIAISTTSQAGPEPPRFLQLIDEGVQLRREGRDAEALKKFEHAYHKRRPSRALAQIALAEQALGRWLRSERHLLAALQDRKDRWIRDNRAPLQQSLAQIQNHLVNIEVDVSVAQAQVLVNGQLVGTHPLSRPVRAIAGTVIIEVRAEGYWTMNRRLDLV